MEDVEIALPRDASAETVTQAIDDAVAQSELTVTLRDSLKKFPGCIHWHLKRGREPGTLELTFWPREHRAWFSVQRGRAAPWTAEALSDLEQKVQRQLFGS